jgi:hypothetical protein
MDILRSIKNGPLSVAICSSINILDKTDIYMHTLAIVHFRALMAIVAVLDLEADTMDVVRAFLNTNVNDNVYYPMRQCFEEEGKVLKLKKALYGLCQSPKLWYDTLASALHRIGVSPNTEEQCPSLTKDNPVLISFYVDDLQIIGSRNATDEKKYSGH